jgi:hypothetical protein
VRKSGTNCWPSIPWLRRNACWNRKKTNGSQTQSWHAACTLSGETIVRFLLL